MPSNSSNLPDGVEDLTAPDSLELETLRRSLIDFYQSKIKKYSCISKEKN